MGADGSRPHRWLPEWRPNRACCGSWIDGGRYFVFQAKVDATATDNIWALPEAAGWFSRRARVPFPLTAGPDRIMYPVGLREGRRIFVLDASARGELSRYDAAKGILTPYLGGISANWLSFAPDGRQAGWTTFPARQLWRGNVDGTGAVRLSETGFRSLTSQWFPDGRRIVAMAETPGQPSRIYMVAAEGKPEEIVPSEGTQSDPSLSPDGTTIAFGRYGTSTAPPPAPSSCTICRPAN